MPVEAVRRLLAPLAGSTALFALLVGGGLLYAIGSSESRESLVTQMLINAIIVIGMQIYIGNTGVLSFGHVGFGAISGYTFAVLAMSVERKATTIRNAPFGLSDIELSPLLATAFAVMMAVLVAAAIGLGLARSAAQSGAVSATVITLAVLFTVREVAVNWDELTGGDRAGLSLGIGETLDSRWPIYLALFGSLLAARLFATSRTGRLAKAAREDHLAAQAMGHNPATQQMVALLLSVVVVGVGSSLRVFELGSITPKFFFFEFTLLTLTMLVVGGRNSTTGAVLGVILISVGNELSRYLAGSDIDGLGFIFRPGLSKLFLGFSMLGFMVLRPNGLLDDWELDDWWFSRWRRDNEQPPTSYEPDQPAPVETGPEGGSQHLRATDVSVQFGGFRALHHASLRASADVITGIIGPNGAGKTTLLNVMTGVVAPTAGAFDLSGTDLTRAETYQIARRGVVRTFQNLKLFPALTVRENVSIGALARSHPHHDPSIEVLLHRSGLWEHRDRRARELDYGSARRLELARAAATAPIFLLLDEPTSGMSDTESLAMIDDVRDIAALVGAGVIVIDHDLAFITGICDEIYCLDQGEVLAVGTPKEIQANPQVQAAYLGSTVSELDGSAPSDSMPDLQHG
jgi:branched-chain amino acid transport system permease protein